MYSSYATLSLNERSGVDGSLGLLRLAALRFEFGVTLEGSGQVLNVGLIPMFANIALLSLCLSFTSLCRSVSSCESRTASANGEESIASNWTCESSCLNLGVMFFLATFRLLFSGVPWKDLFRDSRLGASINLDEAGGLNCGKGGAPEGGVCSRLVELLDML